MHVSQPQIRDRVSLPTVAECRPVSMNLLPLLGPAWDGEREVSSAVDRWMDGMACHDSYIERDRIVMENTMSIFDQFTETTVSSVL